MSFLWGWPIFRNSVSFKEAKCKGPLLSQALVRFRRFLHLSEKTCFFFPSSSKQKRLGESSPKNESQVLYQDDLSCRYTSYDHLFINFMSSNESKHPTRVWTTTILPKLMWDAVWELDKLVFLLGKHIVLFEKKTLHQNLLNWCTDPCEFLLVVLVVVWGIFQNIGFSGEKKTWIKSKLLGHWQRRCFLLRNFNASPG